MGIEPMRECFAGKRLTTWLLHRMAEEVGIEPTLPFGRLQLSKLTQLPLCHSSKKMAEGEGIEPLSFADSTVFKTVQPPWSPPSKVAYDSKKQKTRLALRVGK